MLYLSYLVLTRLGDERMSAVFGLLIATFSIVAVCMTSQGSCASMPVKLMSLFRTQSSRSIFVVFVSLPKALTTLDTVALLSRSRSCKIDNIRE